MYMNVYEVLWWYMDAYEGGMGVYEPIWMCMEVYDGIWM